MATIIGKKHSWSLVSISVILVFREKLFVFCVLPSPVSLEDTRVYLRITILREVKKLSIKTETLGFVVARVF